MNQFFRISFYLLLTIMLVAGCSRARMVSSVWSPSPITIDGSFSNWPRENIQIENNPEYDMYLANDEEFLYVYLIVKSQQVYNNIEQFGLNLYFDTDRRFRRSFGIVYPIGILNSIGNIPGARMEYLQNPGWGNLQENRLLLESIRRDMPERVMLIQRTNRRDNLRPAMVNIEALRAQGIDMRVDDQSRLLNIEMKVPLRSSRTRQFAIEAEPGKPIYVGFEIQPPTVDDLVQDEPQHNVAASDRYTSAVARRQAAMQSMNQLRGEFSRWVKVDLAKSPGR
jgi:hypothetical protein